MLKDIVERDTAGSSNPPAPPSVNASSSGFPAIVHRCQRPKRVSAFAARHAAGSGIIMGKGVDALPAMQGSVAGPSQRSDVPPASPSKAAMEGAQLSEAERVRREVDQENAQRVQEMSPEERAQEVAELEERFGSDVVELMRRRKEQREARLSASQAEPSGSGPSSAAGSAAYQTEAERVYAEVDAENGARVEAMSQEERDQEVRELQEHLGSGVLEALRKRAEKRASEKGKQREGYAAPLDQHAESPAPPVTPPARADRSVRFAPPTSTSRAEKDELADIARYFPNHAPETNKLAWTREAPSTESPSALRFDLSGQLLSGDQQASLPVSMGLHHHGDQPDLAGYSLDEVLLLCRSTVTAQRVSMMGVLAAIIERYIVHDGDASDGDRTVAQECERLDVPNKALSLAVDALFRYRGINVLQRAVALLYNALGGPTWTSQNGRSDVGTLIFQPSSPSHLANISDIPFEDLIPRLAEIAGTADLLPLPSLEQLIAVLRRAARHSTETAETVLALGPVILRGHVTSRAWPVQDEAPPLTSPIRLIRDLISASRTCATELHKAGIVDSLLRYLVVQTWAGSDMSVALALQLAAETLRVLVALGRYGLGSVLATSAVDMWRALEGWMRQRVAAQDHAESREAVLELVAAYFDLVAVWYTCAVDPHRTTPEHDLTWARLEPLQWVEGAVEAVGILSADAAEGAHSATLGAMGSALGAIVAWLEGVQVNGVRHGEVEKREMERRLRLIPLAALVRVAKEQQTPAWEACVLRLLQVHRLLDGEQPSGMLAEADTQLLAARYLPLANPREAQPAEYATLAIQHELVLRLSGPERVRSTLRLLGMYRQGCEPLALDSLDYLLSLTSESEAIPEDARKAVAAIGHDDTLLILRPLLQHAILPDQAHVTGPTTPTSAYLKATTSLFAAASPDTARRTDTESETGRAPPRGLPLASDWLYQPLAELLRSGDSVALQQTPPDWQPSETQLVRAILALVELQLSIDESSMSRTEILWGVMRVYMLEHQPQSQGQGQGQGQEQDGEVFRDEVVAPALTRLMDRLSSHSASSTTSSESAGPSKSAPLERTAAAYLGAEPFFTLYQDLVALFESVSFGDPTFARAVLAPTAMSYPPDYRKHLWANGHVLRLLRASVGEAPVECVSADGPARAWLAYFEPREEDPEVLSLYGQALVRGWVTNRARAGVGAAGVGASAVTTGTGAGWAWSVAIWHLGAFFFTDAAGEVGTDTEKREALDKLRKGLMVAVVGSAPLDVVKALLTLELQAPDALVRGQPAPAGAGSADEAEVARRKEVVRELCGERVRGRVDAL